MATKTPTSTKSVIDYSTTKLIVILGSTAVGKTKLSVELAKLFDGEIISADSMQVGIFADSTFFYHTVCLE